MRVDERDVRAAAERRGVVRGRPARGLRVFERGVRGVRARGTSESRDATESEGFGRAARARAEGCASGGRGVAVRAGGEAGVGGDVRGDDFGARRKLGGRGESGGVRIVDDVSSPRMRGRSEHWNGDRAQRGRARGDTAEYASLSHRVDVLLLRRGSRVSRGGSDVGGGSHRGCLDRGRRQHAR